jgi:hypothetical protein
MIGLEELVIVVGVYALVGIYLRIVYCWLN